jgi:hypothetical protein
MRMSDMKATPKPDKKAGKKKKKVNWTRKVYQIIPNKKTTIGRKMRAQSARRKQN